MERGKQSVLEGRKGLKEAGHFGKKKKRWAWKTLWVWPPFTRTRWGSPNFSCLTVIEVPSELTVHPPFSINGEIKHCWSTPSSSLPFRTCSSTVSFRQLKLMTWSPSWECQLIIILRWGKVSMSNRSLATQDCTWSQTAESCTAYNCIVLTCSPGYIN